LHTVAPVNRTASGNIITNIIIAIIGANISEFLGWFPRVMRQQAWQALDHVA